MFFMKSLKMLMVPDIVLQAYLERMMNDCQIHQDEKAPAKGLFLWKTASLKEVNRSY
jgi:hypothetical protein